ncbi:MAG: hypothetical protein CYPHOPRED_005460 [Cyphobasidiales sp. Tagirdzhanova-0007]|nr:MAG: hypothetical protein CYPHOPRED_005460 [Cyphobasidiales sp. Tagirdzhanova-0007]
MGGALNSRRYLRHSRRSLVPFFILLAVLACARPTFNYFISRSTGRNTSKRDYATEQSILGDDRHALAASPSEVAQAFRQFRNQHAPHEVTLATRQAMFMQLCQWSRGSKPCSEYSPLSYPDRPKNVHAGSDLLGSAHPTSYESHAAENITSDMSQRITGVVPSSSAHADLLAMLGYSFVRFVPEDTKLWDVIWIIAAGENGVDEIYDMLAEHKVLHPVFRIISEDIIYNERPTLGENPNYNGWLLQQDIKLAAAWAVRTDYYINLDADSMISKNLTYEDLFEDNKAITPSDGSLVSQI